MDVENMLLDLKDLDEVSNKLMPKCGPATKLGRN